MIRLHNRCLCIRHRAFLYTGAPKSTNSTLCTGANPAATFNIWGFDKLVSDCEMTEPAPAGGGGSGLEIVKGTCSQDTEDRLSTPSCIKFLAEQPTIVHGGVCPQGRAGLPQRKLDEHALT